MRNQFKPLLFALCGLSVAACVSPTSEGESEVSTPAVITEDTPAVRARLKSELGAIVGRANIEFGPGDFTTSSRITVLPPPSGPLQGRNPAMPQIFDLVVKGEHCYAVDRETGAKHHLVGLTCQPE